MDEPIAQWGLCSFEIYVRNFTRYGPQLEFLIELKRYVILCTVKLLELMKIQIQVNETFGSIAHICIVATYY